MKSLFTFCFLFIANFINAQSCLPDGITFTTQEGIDNFQSNYPGCSEVLGPVTIDGNQIQNLLGLSNITKAGQLQISNTQITSLQGLHNMRTVSVMSVYNNPGLVNMEGLNSLDSVYFLIRIDSNVNLVNLEGLGSLSYMQNVFNIRNNSLLENLSGLDELEYIGGLAVENNGRLTNFSGMSMLSEIGGFVYVLNNDELQSLEGLENVSTIYGSFEIKDNELLTSLSGLEGLQSINGDFSIWNNLSLTSLHGLESLSYIERRLSILQNPALVNIEALDQVQTVKEIRINNNSSLVSLGNFTNLNPSFDWDGFIAQQNPLLSDCAVVPFCQRPELQLFFQFSSNATGCNSHEEVVAACLVGIQEFAEDAGIGIYPNPATTGLRFSGMASGEVITATVYDQHGIKVKTQHLHEPALDVSLLHAGLYFLTLQTESKQMYARFLKF